ncbi:hypothetical protein CPB83DRAFT_860700 [Crepidotus variabilis]|uniref:Uncharacterized protein n=1 Tax=Crepidotus variabilis TaxID=179855 RepID=A0A9P6E957_9AGAR|nr:hypothetical protein CPB83DRAFT_860700 [Crepidotus variabilis]
MKLILFSLLFSFFLFARSISALPLPPVDQKTATTQANAGGNSEQAPASILKDSNKMAGPNKQVSFKEELHFEADKKWEENKKTLKGKMKNLANLKRFGKDRKLKTDQKEARKRPNPKPSSS